MYFTLQVMNIRYAILKSGYRNWLTNKGDNFLVMIIILLAADKPHPNLWGPYGSLCVTQLDSSVVQCFLCLMDFKLHQHYKRHMVTFQAFSGIGRPQGALLCVFIISGLWVRIPSETCVFNFIFNTVSTSL